MPPSARSSAAAANVVSTSAANLRRATVPARTSSSERVAPTGSSGSIAEISRRNDDCNATGPRSLRTTSVKNGQGTCA